VGVSPTERLYYRDPYLRSFDARIVEVAEGRVYLDRTAFYPDSGGQPCDYGVVAGVAVEQVIDEDQRIAHVLAGPVGVGAVRCEIDWARRFDHMQQHSGQHLLSAALAELFGIQTVSFHLGAETSTIDIAAGALSADQVLRAERRANEVVFENRPLRIEFAAPEDVEGLRKPSDRAGELRIISIEDLDRSACGGTHVRSTAEIGPVAIRRLDKIRGNVRVEFLCGLRAIGRARADFDGLTRIARTFSAALDETPELVASQARRVLELEKVYRKLATEAAVQAGRDLYAATVAGDGGLRRVVREGRIDDEMRAVAQGFVSGEKAVFVVVCADPPSVLVAASKDSGVNAGGMVKSAVSAVGGRGGGSPGLAQGSVPGVDELSVVKSALVGG
jgi:alanyl-tRNA synthetase